MRYGLIGDIHAEDALLDAALRYLDVDVDVDVDAVLAVGDIVDGLGDVDRCCALLAGAQVVRGNHERWFLANQMRTLPEVTLAVTPETRAFLSALPATRVIDSILLCHGTGENDMEGLRPDDEGYALACNANLARVAHHAIVVGGHTHRRMVRTLGSTVFVNPGTLYRHHDPGFMTLDLAARTVDIHVFRPDQGISTTRHRLDDRFP